MHRIFNIVIPVTLMILAVCLSLFYLYNMDSSSPYVKIIKNIDKKFDIINLGNSHGSAFKYGVYGGINGKSVHRAAITPYYDLQNYKYLKPYLKKNAIVIIPISYFSFGLNENRIDSGDDNPFVNIFYYYLPKKDIYDYSIKKNMRLVFQEIKTNYFKYIDTFSANVKKKKKKKKKEKQGDAKKKYLKFHAKKNVKRHKKVGSFSDPEVNIEYYSLIIEDALSSGFKPVLVTTPYYVAYNNYFGEEWLSENYFKYLIRLKDKYNIPYLNYSSDSRFVSNINSFKDSDHLIEKSRVYFSKIFFSDLKKMEIFDKDYKPNIPLNYIEK